jgi:hypothetical protein
VIKPQFGDWIPGTHNLALAVIQILSVGQAGLRGVDYIQSRAHTPSSPSVRSVEQISALPLWGALFLASAAVLIVAIAGGWIVGIFVGHAMLASTYIVLGCALFAGVVNRDVLSAFLGSAVLCGGLWLAVERWQGHDCLRFALALSCVFGGGWWASTGLGLDFRSATGVITAGLLQVALLVGLAVFVYRDREAAELRVVE